MAKNRSQRQIDRYYKNYLTSLPLRTLAAIHFKELFMVDVADELYISIPGFDGIRVSGFKKKQAAALSVIE